MNLKKDAKRLLNGKGVISNYVKTAKQIEGTFGYIIQLPRIENTDKKIFTPYRWYSK